MVYNIIASARVNAFDRTINNTRYPAEVLLTEYQGGLLYAIQPNLIAGSGYTFVRVNPFKSIHYNEHRLWEQIKLSAKINKGKLTNRLRLEQRFIQRISDGTYPFALRMRYQLGYSMPLQGKTLDKGEFYLNSYGEAYMNLKSESSVFLNEGWGYAGVGYYMQRAGKIETGYNLQLSRRDLAGSLRLIHFLQVIWITNFDFFKK